MQNELILHVNLTNKAFFGSVMKKEAISQNALKFSILNSFFCNLYIVRKNDEK